MLYVASSFLETESSGLSKDEYLSVNVSVEIVTCVDQDSVLESDTYLLLYFLILW